MAIAFLPPPPALVAQKKKEEAKGDGLPVFKRRWWFKDNRLDARPVAWSLVNRPQDWRYTDPEERVLEHIPSKHQFWVGSSRGNYHLWSARCGCHHQSEGGGFQKFQQGLFHRAYMQWRKWHRPPQAEAERFANHFLHPELEPREEAPPAQPQPTQQLIATQAHQYAQLGYANALQTLGVPFGGTMGSFGT